MAALNPQPDCIDLEQQVATPLVPEANSIRVYADSTGNLAAIKSDGSSALPTGGTISAPEVSITSTSVDIDITSAGALNVQTPTAGMEFDAQGQVVFNSGVGSMDFNAFNGHIDFTGLSMDFGSVGGDLILDTTTGPSNISMTAGTAFISMDATHVTLPSVQVFANNAAALAGGLLAGDLYRTSTGQAMIVF